MNRTRFITLVALALVLYIAASAGAAAVRFDLGQALSLLFALVLAFTPAFLGRRESSDAPARVGVLGVSLSLSLSAWVARGLFALAGELFAAALLPVGGLLLLELALAAPDVPPRLVRQARSLGLVRALTAAAALLGVIAALPPIWLFGRSFIAPSVVAVAPSVFAFSCLCLAIFIRLSRRRFGSDARAMAANLWPTIGLCVGALLLLLSLWVARRGVAPGYADVSMSLASLTVVLGHASLVSAAHALGAGLRARRCLATGLAVFVVVSAGLAMRSLIPVDPVLRAALLVGLLLGFEGLRRAFSRLAEALLAPDRGRLLRAICEAEVAIAGSASLEDLAARVLRPLRRAALVPEAAPVLITMQPVRELRLDAAGQPQARERRLAVALEKQFERSGVAPLVRSDLAARLVRRPELREVLHALDEHDALVALPLVAEAELEGVLFIARGARNAPLTLEELAGLERFGRSFAALIAVFSARARAHARADQAVANTAALEARVEELSDELRRVRSQFQVLASSRAREPARPVAYSVSMRALIQRLEQVAPHDLPVGLLVEVGASALPSATVVHVASGRSSKPFVVADCGALAPEDATRRLFGDLHEKPALPGLLETAEQGTLLLSDAAALPLKAQQMLAQALSERRARPVGGDAAYEVHARLILAFRTPISELVAVGALVPQLARWFEPTGYRVPPLRERQEDLESLLLLAVDRAARVYGRIVPGLTPEVLRALVEHTWPGNEEELESVMSRAVAACRGPRITLSDLPPLAVQGAPQQGSFLDQEREILRRALERAAGNATRAARALGLKRTTLLEKLKRHGLDDSGADTTH